MRRKFNRDVMNMAKPRDVAMSAMTVMDRLQDARPEVQLMGIAACFLSVSEFYDIPAQEVFTATKNLINGDEGKRSEFRGIDAYMEGEWV